MAVKDYRSGEAGQGRRGEGQGERENMKRGGGTEDADTRGR